MSERMIELRREPENIKNGHLIKNIHTGEVFTFNRFDIFGFVYMTDENQKLCLFQMKDFRMWAKDEATLRCKDCRKITNLKNGLCFDCVSLRYSKDN